MKIFIANDYDGLYGKFWSELGDVTTRTPEFMADPESFGLVGFTGGEDVSPELYGHENLQSHSSLARDKREMLVFEMAHKHKIPMTGICRGSQFLNVMCGGTMVQHLAKNHGGSPHLCQTEDLQEFSVTSSHHQMSVPGPKGRVLAWAKERLEPEDLVYAGFPLDLARSIDNYGRVMVTEAIYYPHSRVFGVQHHPEWQEVDCDAAQWTLGKIRELLLGTESTARADVR